jgi:4,5-DOPA dioxygenase extradiol
MTLMPTLFISHGSPMFALEPTRAGPLLRELADRLPRPRAVLVLSSHWITAGLQVGFAARPETIHDFGGFPAPLYAIEYPAPGSPEVAARALALLQAAGWSASPAPGQGLDHGTWVPLRHMFMNADVPVLQVSMPRNLNPADAVRLGRALAPLAHEGVLIVGSGSLTHNLYEERGPVNSPTQPYVTEFVDWARAAVQSHDEASLVNFLSVAPHAQRAHPTIEHYLPLPFAFGAAAADAPAHILDGGVDYGMLSMDSYLFGERPGTSAMA